MAALSPYPKFQAFDANGDPLSGGKLYTYAAGTSTPLATYTDAGGGTPNANPVILNSRGEANVWTGASAYKFTLLDSTDALIWTVDNVSGEVSMAALGAAGGASMVGYGATTVGTLLLNSIATVVQTIALLRAVDKTRYTKAFVTGYYAQGDGGGGDYYYDSTDTTSADNGGTIIVASDGGRWKLSYTDSVTLKQFGGKPDGVTDNSAFFTAAATALGDGKRLIVTEGSSYYAFTSAAEIDGKYGFVLEFCGAKAAFVATSTNVCLKITNSQGVKVIRPTISGKVGSSHGIQIGAVSSPASGPAHYCVIEDAFIQGVDGNGIELKNGILCNITRPNITANRVFPFSVTGAGTTKIGVNVASNPSGFNSAFSIEDPVIEGMGTHGVHIDTVFGGRVEGGTVEGNGNRAGTTGNVTHANIRVLDSTSIFIDEVYCEQNNDVERNIIIAGGYQVHLTGGVCGTNSVLRGQVEVGTSGSPAESVFIREVFGNQFTLGANTKRCLIEDCVYATNGGDITNNGESSNRTVNNWQSNGDLVHNANFLVVQGTGAPTNGNVGIELKGTDKALLLSRMTTTQRDAMTPVEGMIILNSSVPNVQAYLSGAWVNLS